mmetsp:Transcript_8802/g.8628  ORF Transcript_8802/g.8628 Transcript_8802/m.8628 type:complete len:119 (+) Transcript_8802:421-777(+)
MIIENSSHGMISYLNNARTSSLEISADSVDLILFLLREKKVRKPIFNSVEDEGATLTLALFDVEILVITGVAGAKAVTTPLGALNVAAAATVTTNKVALVNFILDLIVFLLIPENEWK